MVTFIIEKYRQLSELNEAQRKFEIAGMRSEERTDFLEGLHELRNNHYSIFSSIYKSIPASYDNLEILLNHAKGENEFPLLQDGDITFEYNDLFSKTVKEQTRLTRNQSSYDKLIQIIEFIEQEFPNKFEEIMCSTELYRPYLLYCAVAGNMDDTLKKKLFNNGGDIDDYICDIYDKKKDLFFARNYPIDNIVNRLTNTVVDKLFSVLDDNNLKKLSENRFLKLLNIVPRSTIHKKTYEKIILNVPIPESLKHMQIECAQELSDSIINDMEIADKYINAYQNFQNWENDKREEFAEFHLKNLAKAFGINPPPDFSFRDNLKKTGIHGIYNGIIFHRSKPMGFIKMEGDKSSPKYTNDYFDFINTLDHEFSHGLGDVSQLSISSEYQEWLAKDNNQGIKLGHEKHKDNMKELALVSSFNGATNVDLYEMGIYINSSVDNEKYRTQYEERQARNFQDITAQSTLRRINMISVAVLLPHEWLEKRKDIMRNMIYFCDNGLNKIFEESDIYDVYRESIKSMHDCSNDLYSDRNMDTHKSMNLLDEIMKRSISIMSYAYNKLNYRDNESPLHNKWYCAEEISEHINFVHKYHNWKDHTSANDKVVNNPKSYQIQ